ncbi:MAG: glutamate racemase [Chloroflexota bacterium]
MSIAIFDSGIGGLSVWREIQKLIPEADLLYLADQAHVPYGGQPVAEIRRFMFEITKRLIGEGAEVIVVACNTATAAGLTTLRKSYPGMSFVGMEPAIKSAAYLTHSGRIGVMATQGTLKSERYRQLSERFANGLQIFEDPCLGLVHEIEKGNFDSDRLTGMLQAVVRPMIKNGVDTIILGCTHYPLILPQLRAVVGPDITLIDPAPAVARQTLRLWNQLGKRTEDTDKKGTYRFVTTGDNHQFKAQLKKLDIGVTL